MLTIRDLDRKNFKGEDFIKSKIADEFKIKNQPNQNQLICGMQIADKMQEIRNFFKLPIMVNSGFRCQAVNTKVGGSKNSLHMQFLACDFNVDDLEPHEVVADLKNSGISIDKCFVERGCVHVQIQQDQKKNRNFFGTAVKVNGEWVVIPEIKKV